jgi:cellulose synthase/poly-beta-1,6-N-acetylglucosamine synthase-like glycosyltransferase
MIVLDDASSDSSVEVIKQYLDHTESEAQLVVNDTNSGSVFRQWQKGIARCKGDLLWIAEADDLADCHFLDELCSAFLDPDLVLAFSQSRQIDKNGKALAHNYLEYTNGISDCWLADYVRDGREEISEALSIKNTIPNVSAVLFRRRALEQAITSIGDDLFDYRVAGDWLIYLYVLVQGKVYYNAKPLNLHRRHTHSVTNSTQKFRHLQEVCQVQAIARTLTAPSKESLAKANAYIEHLHEYFELSPQKTKELLHAFSRAV